MDNLVGPTSTKKRCSSQKEKIQLNECKRVFQLRQQFPSTVKEALKEGINIVEPVALTVTTPDVVTVLSNSENRLQKLRILSPDGRDLGEFSVTLRSPNLLKGNTVTITEPNLHFAKKPVILPSISHTKAFPRILRQGTTKVPKTKIEDTSGIKDISWTDSNSILHQRQSLLSNRMLTNSDATKGKMEEQTYSNINSVLPVNKICSDHSMHQTSDSDNKHRVHNGIDSIDADCMQIQEVNTENDATSVVVKTPLKKIVKSPSPTKLAIKFSDIKNMQMLSKNRNKGKIIATIKKTENGRIITSLKRVAADFVQMHEKINKNLDQNSLGNNDRKNLDTRRILDDNNSLQNKFNIISTNNQVKEVKTQNIMTIIPNNEVVSFNQNAVLREHNTSVKSSTENKTNVNHIAVTPCEDSKTGSQNNCPVIINDHAQHIPDLQVPCTDVTGQSNEQINCLKDLPQKNLLNRLDIIKKAMDSVKDSELREMALKALADCNIGIERHVPICPPEKHKSVHDTQVQTMVFGLLEPKTFILIDKDIDDINRLNQIILHDLPNNSNLPLADNSHSNNLISKIQTNTIEQESPFDLDSFMDSFWKENSDAFKMKETLSVTRIRCNNILEHLEKDFEHAKRYDQNGMLNIHNAIISNNVHLVRRHLMILQHCKESVDVLTESGATSLELAISYDVCSEIVNLLLEAGAQPVILKSIHESALIIASKHSSPYLLTLISRITDSKLLDQIDLEGLAAIHYCSMRGNLQGVKALLSAGATIDLKDMKSGRTALFHAIDNGHMSLMQVLLKAGAVTNLTNYAGQTPLSIMSDKSICQSIEKR
ncbi:uncharacterized protein LOC105425089 [Pogonomyrmex barbatus]|uniref:Uncharacterized protein LOC105425089 n=1 Tax=Pogonomyrmex barbatus TaxID=144034 RepID=A0A6I9W271_9HYME|nr:uncharacterized protein LOC105425089 [Pogonomyrmex barbatus]XP_011633953.1 uncharacterized protein LOC105425089 [Pogonomyrmex barbatus]